MKRERLTSEQEVPAPHGSWPPADDIAVLPRAPRGSGLPEEDSRLTHMLHVLPDREFLPGLEDDQTLAVRAAICL